MLEVREAVRRFGGLAAVDGVSLVVERGSVTGLIGPNGAGKSTLFNLIAGDLRLTSGSILLDGVAIQGEPAHARLGRGLGRTFQIPRPFPDMTVLENLLVAAQDQAGERILPNWIAPKRVAAEERTNIERARSVLDFLELGRLSGKPARMLSGGQRKLLELGRVLMAAPKIVLLDEPAAGVNPALLDEVCERIEQLNKEGITFVVVEHNMDVVARLCGQVHVMAGGRIVTAGAPAQVLRDARVAEAYLGGPAR